MKKTILTSSLFLLIATIVWAQVPEKMTYQAVVRDASNNLVQNQSVGMQLSILQGTVGGNAVYVETHSITTNDNGLVTTLIGSGSVQSGSIDGINWADGPYFLKTETDPSGGTSYTISATSQLVTVPYSFLAGNVALEDGSGGTWGIRVDPSGNLWSYPLVYNPSNPPLIELREIFYDYPADDDNFEWVKIYNPNPYPVNLSEYRIASGGLLFQEIFQLSGTIPATTCWVVGGTMSDGINGNPVYDIAVNFGGNLQNSGSTSDGVAIYYGDVLAPGNNPIDVVVYGAPNSNTNNLPGTDGLPASVDVEDVSAGNSIIKVGSSWQVNASPSPSVCP